MRHSARISSLERMMRTGPAVADDGARRPPVSAPQKVACVSRHCESDVLE